MDLQTENTTTATMETTTDTTMETTTATDTDTTTAIATNTTNTNINKTKSRKEHILFLLKKLTESAPQDLATSQIFYPVMQCADVFFLNCDITSLGMDQRKVNMLALEYCDKIKRKLKPIIVSHHMLMGLDGSDKMSKTNPDNTIFMNDSENDIKRKIKQAFCAPGNIDKNPLIDWIQHLILELKGSITIKTKTKTEIKQTESNLLKVQSTHDLQEVQQTELDLLKVQPTHDLQEVQPTHDLQTYTEINSIKDNFKSLLIHPKDLKIAITQALIELIKPVQERLKASKHQSIKASKH